jgi:glutathione synthase/RimK-type ligase-like ATP-grasp enzyme
MANTPVHYLIEDAPFDAHFVMAMDADEAVNHLRDYGDVVFNLLCDVDQCGALLTRSAELLDRLNKPVLNPPRKILPTGRDAVADMISQIPGCRTARVVRQTAAELTAFAAAQESGTFPEPILVRQAGTHGGDKFERVDDAAGLTAFIKADATRSFYLCNYIDYRSADGYFRKYRMIVVRGRGIPYHLAIGAHWKIHHFRTDMANQAWMQQEEEAFLRTPESVLSNAHRAALDAIARVLDLDFCGIDFAIDRDGTLVIFEANAAMLVQPDDSKFAYKAAANANVKAAFTEMLAAARRAQ